MTRSPITRPLTRAITRALFAAAAITTGALDFSSPALLGAQTPPTPPRPPRASSPAPAPVPSPATRPSRAMAPRAIDPRGVIDEAWMQGRMALDEARMALDIDLDRLKPLAALAPLPPMPPMTPMGPMAPMPPGFDAEWAGAMANLDFARAELAGADFPRGVVWTSGARALPPASWQKDDPADSLYSMARKALSSDAYRRAAELFRRIRDQYPKSTYTPDAPYWEAFALQRLGNESDLRAAQEALSWQAKSFPKAATRGDAASLATRIDAALARRGDPQAYRELVGRVNQATSDGCPRESDDERVQALNALARMDSAQVMPILTKVLARREPCTQALRRTAVWLVASRRPSNAPQLLMNVAKTDPDREVRDQAVFWMSNVPTDEAAGMLIELARGGGDLDLRKRAVYALSRSKAPRAASTLREIATDANAPTELRSEALSWYMRSAVKPTDDPMNFLKDVYGKADEQSFRQRVLQIIGDRKNDEARDFLLGVAQNSRENIDTRRQALYALQRAGATTAQLVTLYDRTTNDVDMRKQTIAVLAGLKDNGGTDKLLDIARNEKNLELRKQAVSYLSRTKDPRAMELLQEIILK